LAARRPHDSRGEEEEEWILRSQIREKEMVVMTRVRGFIDELRSAGGVAMTREEDLGSKGEVALAWSVEGTGLLH
jgi:hypothetical protein